MARQKPHTYHTDAPLLSDAQIARIRATAHRYVLAGGGLFNVQGGDDHSIYEHIENVHQEIHRGEPDLDLEAMLSTLTADTSIVERMYNDIILAKTQEEDAAFLFGCFVGLEFAGLTFGRLATIPTVEAPRNRKAPKR